VRRNPKVLIRALAALAATLLVTMIAAPAFAAPTMNVSQLTGLQDGQTVTISGGGFKANLNSIAIGQCTADYVGPADCNTSGGATFKNADASGNVSSFTIVVKEVFGSHDCTKEQCVIAASPLPTNADDATIAANTVVMKMSFASAEAPADPTPTDTATQAPSDAGSLPQTGAGDSMPVVLLAATTLLAAGVGAMLLVPGRRREERVR